MFVRIIDVHIPITGRTDLVFKACEYEAALIKARWNRSNQIDKSRQISITPMPLDGEHDPFRKVGTVESEVERLRELHGKAIFDACYPQGRLDLFEELYAKAAKARNPWAEARAKAVDEAAAQAKADEADRAAQLVERAVLARAKARPAAPAEEDADDGDEGDEGDDAPPAGAKAGQQPAGGKQSKLSQQVQGRAPAGAPG